MISRRSLLLSVLLLLLASAIPGDARMPGHNGTVTKTVLNCATTPSQAGCTIVAQSGTTFSSTVQDNNSQIFRFHGPTLQVDSGSGFGNWGGAAQLQINNGNGAGTSYVAEVCPTPNLTLWRKFNSLPLVINPTTTLPNKFHNVTQGVDYNNLLDMTQDTGVLHNGDTLSIDALPAGLPIYYTAGRVQRDNLTFNIPTGVILGCTVDESNAVITTDTNGGANQVAHVTLNLNSSEIAYAQDICNSCGDFHGINVGHVCHLTAGSCDGTGSPSYAINGGYIHDNDFGIQSPQGDGTEAAVTITGTILDHNGSADATAPTHNIYIGTAGSALNLVNVASYCEGYPAGDFSTSGFEIKVRGPGGTYTGVTAAEVSAHGYTDCSASAAMDFSCGGNFTVGTTGTGNGAVIQVGANMQNTAGAIRYGAEATGGLPNCPTTTGWTVNHLTVNRAYIIMDGGISGTKAIYNPNNAAISGVVSVSNSIIVCNGLQTCNSTVLGSNVSDGGGNTYYSNRAAALAAGQTWATPCTGETTTLCPIPTPL